ncbi:MAG: CinA family nicotinamide mononucleotide deamidase-related protein [Thermodesulfobacteriota bacterium]|nr:CinA family nicotinamide mononucleotide deamidase-related protein [Thermodesulfobacteriota bacterium]
MYGEIITIGNELIAGRTLDSNSCYAAGRLASSGLSVTRITSIGDDHRAVSEALTTAVKASRFVIVTGGLGSTSDDITNEIVAEALNRPLSPDRRLLEQIKRHAEARGIEMTPALEKMAWMPEGARKLSHEGTAFGFSLIQKGARLYFLPGVPDQMRQLMDRVVLPELLSVYKALPVVRQHVLKVYGLDEPSIAGILEELEGKNKDIIFGFYPHFPENHITMRLRGEDEPAVAEELGRIEEEIRRLLGIHIFAAGDQGMEEVVGHMLLAKGMTVSVAESCTGGQIGQRLTNVPGSSRYFLGGVVAYSNESKVDLIHVLPGTLEKHGAVSDKTVREMASGVREQVKTDLGLAVTGIAGPDGGDKDKPVGTVHIGLATGNDIYSAKYRFWGNREQIRLNSSMMALDWIRRYLNGNPFLPGI